MHSSKKLALAKQQQQQAQVYMHTHVAALPMPAFAEVHPDLPMHPIGLCTSQWMLQLVGMRTGSNTLQK